VEKYRFGSRSADFLIRRQFGVYFGAVCTTPAGIWAVVNTNSLIDRALFTGTVAPVEHDCESTEDRMAHRTANWTPAVLHRRGSLP
jgi:hypothetical protein